MIRFKCISKSYLGFFAALLLASACGGSTPQTKGIFIDYYMERINTNAKQNYLRIETNEKAEDYTFSVGGIGFVTDIEMDKKYPLQDRVLLEYDEEAIYTLGVTFFSSDGIKIIDDTLAFEYSEELPPNPVVSWDEEASNDDNVTLLLAGSLDRKTVDIWVQGDVQVNPQGSWMTIPADLRLPLQLSKVDGLKNMQIQYRNIYGSVSDFLDISILRKETLPQNCSLSAPLKYSPTRSQRVEVIAPGNGPMYYQFSGDVDANRAKKFEDNEIVEFNVTPTQGLKNVTLKMWDIAKNPCPDINFELVYNPGVLAYSANFKDEIIWSDSIHVTLENHLNALPSDDPWMYIHGPHVVEDSKTQKWVPYEDAIDITLTEVDGNRDVYVKYKLSENSAETETLIVSLYLRPRAFLRNGFVTIAEIVGLKTVSILGCEQTYANVAWQNLFACDQSLRNDLEVEFIFSDGTSLKKSVE